MERLIRKTLELGLCALLLTSILVTSADAVRPVPQILRIHGDAQSLATTIFPVKERFERETGIRIVMITETSPLVALSELDSGQSDALLTAMPFNELNRQADKAGLIRNNIGMTQHLILLGELKYSVIVHPRNPVATLTEKQLRKIFSGRYRNWEDVDGPDAPISVIRGQWSTGTSWILADRIMGGEALLKDAVAAADVDEIIAKVSGSQNSIGVIPKSAVKGSVKTIQSPELGMKGPVIFVTVGFPQPMLLKLLKYLKETDQKTLGF